MNEFLSEKVRNDAVMKVKTEKGKTAADIGAGEGFVTEGLLNAGLNVIAVESSPEKLEFLKERFGHLREVQIVPSAPGKIDIADESVDYVFAGMYLISTEDPPAIIKEMRRVLKPGGKLAITDLTGHSHDNLLKELGHRWPGFNMPDLYGWFVQAGMKEISIEVLNQKCTYTDESGNSSTFGYFLAHGEK